MVIYSVEALAEKTGVDPRNLRRLLRLGRLKPDVHLAGKRGIIRAGWREGEPLENAIAKIQALQSAKAQLARAKAEMAEAG